MTTLGPTRKVSRRQELREDKVITFYAGAIDFFENHRSTVYFALGGIVVVLISALGFSYIQSSRNDEAVTLMVKAVALYETGQYQAAIDGDASFTGLVEVAEEFGGTDAGNLARYYAADALFRSGDMTRALSFFEHYDRSSNYLGASAYAGEAAIHEMNDNYERAGELYMQAASIFSSRVTSPEYLLNAGRAYEKAGNLEGARRAYEHVRDDYSDSQQARDIDFFLARITAKTKSLSTLPAGTTVSGSVDRP